MLQIKNENRSTLSRSIKGDEVGSYTSIYQYAQMVTRGYLHRKLLICLSAMRVSN